MDKDHERIEEIILASSLTLIDSMIKIANSSSRLFNDVLNHFGSIYSEFISQMRQYADAIGEDCIWGFVDGTTQKIARPTVNQRMFYSGHKRYHYYKYQAVVTPDGLVSSLAGPVKGVRGDWALFHKSKIADDIIEEFDSNSVPIGEELCLYEDPAYAMTGVTKSSYRRPPEYVE
ncbi:hypothetical protein AAP_02456 [Ascosphaera apis ARSEF 7405]|uniref:DDE Tnp4 domain-containing protein n=1 Tax=Ascosphaera apis ARSEF 7405 TaxID=392613 RepID=A0A168AA05_9EURO|nr:hypothetical protein AAP_02456 [Ascosphaera apis ARSEF 7405]